jgi:hypothetical protein
VATSWFTDKQTQEWAFTGDPLTAQEGKRTRLRPEVARAWLQADEANIRHRIEPKLAKTLHKAGWDPQYVVAARLALAETADTVWFDEGKAFLTWVGAMPQIADRRILAAYLCAGFGVAEARADLDSNRLGRPAHPGRVARPRIAPLS